MHHVSFVSQLEQRSLENTWHVFGVSSNIQAAFWLARSTSSVQQRTLASSIGSKSATCDAGPEPPLCLQMVVYHSHWHLPADGRWSKEVKGKNQKLWSSELELQGAHTESEQKRTWCKLDPDRFMSEPPENRKPLTLTCLTRWECLWENMDKLQISLRVLRWKHGQHGLQEISV